VIVTPTTVNVTEGGSTDTYTIVLGSQPSADVTISFNTGTQLQPISSVTFTSGNWNIAKTITVAAVDDGAVEGVHGGTIQHSVTSSDANYNGFSASGVTANITDNDFFGVVVSPTSVDVAEGGATDTYTLVLGSQPSADVTISFNTGTQLQPISSVTFTSADWNTAKTITVTAVDDLADEGSHTGTVSHTASSSDSNYDGISIGSVTANITDNDANEPPTAMVTNGQCSSTNLADGTLNLTLNDPDGDPLTLTLVSNSNPALVPNNKIVLGGSGNNRTVTITAAAKKSGTATITLNLSDGKVTVPAVVTVKVGSDSNETLTGTSGIDMMFGLAGRNTLNGNAGNDLLCGGNANDTINGGDGNDILDGAKGDDALNGGNDNDLLRGSSGNDSLTGGAGADSFSGGSGSDVATDFNAAQGDTQDGTVP